MHETEFDQKGWEESIWEQVLEEFGCDMDSEKMALAPSWPVMRKRFEQLKEELSS